MPKALVTILGILAVALVIYNLILGATVRKIGIPGIFEVEFGEPNGGQGENNGIPPEDDTQPGAPRLLSPADGATVTQPYEQRWDFRWAEPQGVSGVREYQIFVLGPSASLPIVDNIVRDTRFSKPRKCSYVVGQNRHGWSWKVRARLRNGTWSPWSEERRFSVSPRNQDRFCQRCPDAPGCP